MNTRSTTVRWAPFLPLSDHLTKLDLTASDISDEACSTIGRFQLLTILSLRKTEVGDIGLKKLKVLKNLQSFNLTETKVSDYGIAPLLEFEKLQKPTPLGYQNIERAIEVFEKTIAGSKNYALTIIP